MRCYIVDMNKTQQRLSVSGSCRHCNQSTIKNTNAVAMHFNIQSKFFGINDTPANNFVCLLLDSIK